MTPLALPLALSLSLGQAAPGAAPATPPAGAAPVPAPGPALRELRLERLPGGGWRAALGGQPVAGADLYRAALRPDLAGRAEARRDARTFALVAAGTAAAGGPALGWLVFHARRREVPGCAAPSDGGACQALADQIRATNRADERRGLLLGGAAGAAAAGLALWWWAAHPAIAPDLDEAEALVRAYEARRAGSDPGSAPAPPPGRPGGETGLRLRLAPLPGGLLASLDWRG